MGSVLLTLIINVKNQHIENVVISKRQLYVRNKCKALQAKLPDFNLKRIGKIDFESGMGRICPAIKPNILM